MFKRNHKKAASVLVMMLMLVLTASSGVFADDGAFKADPVTIVGNHLVGNNETLKNGRHTFVLTAESEDTPMPADAEGTVKKVTINSNEPFSFGTITYQKPGVYDYTVSREIIPTDSLTQDDSVYKCHVAVFTEGTSVVVFEKKGTEGKPNKIEYTDTYNAPAEEEEPEVTPEEEEEDEPEVTPEKEDEPEDKTPARKERTTTSSNKVKTGDTNAVFIYGGIFCAAALAAGFLIGRNRRKKDDPEPEDVPEKKEEETDTDTES